VVQTIAAAHGGRAWAQNLPHGGARVTIAASDGTTITDAYQPDRSGSVGSDRSEQGA
jgi:hypothetical protein